MAEIGPRRGHQGSGSGCLSNQIGPAGHVAKIHKSHISNAISRTRAKTTTCRRENITIDYMPSFETRALSNTLR